MSLCDAAVPLQELRVRRRLGIFYWLITWFFATTRLEGSNWRFQEVGDILNKDPDFHWFPHIFIVAPLAAANNVMLGLLCLGLWVVLFVYADAAYGKRVRVALASAALGGAHCDDARALRLHIMDIEG